MDAVLDGLLALDLVLADGVARGGLAALHHGGGDELGAVVVGAVGCDVGGGWMQ